MKFDLGEVLTRMWKIGWNHKVLWLWQMLPGLLMPILFIANPGFLMMMPEPFSSYADEPWVLFVFISMTFIFIVPSLFVQVMAQLTTTYGAMKVEKGAEKIGFRELFSESLPYFWRVLGLYAIFFGGWMAIYFAFIMVFFAGSMLTMGLASLCFVPFFFLFIPLVIVGFSVLELAQAAIIADDMPLMSAISRGWELFRAHWLGVVVLMIILYFGMTTISSLLVFPMMFPMMFLQIGMIETQGNIGTMMLIFFAVFLLMSVIIFAVQGILMAFFQSGWAALYLRINRTENTPVMAEPQ